MLYIFIIIPTIFHIFSKFVICSTENLQIYTDKCWTRTELEIWYTKNKT